MRQHIQCALIGFGLVSLLGLSGCAPRPPAGMWTCFAKDTYQYRWTWTALHLRVARHRTKEMCQWESSWPRSCYVWCEYPTGNKNTMRYDHVKK